jgi:hypothetical protein
VTTEKKSTPKKSPLNLYQRISAVMQDVTYLQKDGHVQYKNVNYKAVSETKVTAAVRSSLIQYGLVVIPHTIQNHKKEGTLTSVDVAYKIVNIDNPEEFEIVMSAGSGNDTGDKGIGKALTYAYKYLFLRMFAIPTGEDPDQISSDEFNEQTVQSNQIADIQHRLIELGADESDFLSYLKISDFSKMTNADYDRAIKALNQKERFLRKENISGGPPDIDKEIDNAIDRDGGVGGSY